MPYTNEGVGYSEEETSKAAAEKAADVSASAASALFQALEKEIADELKERYASLDASGLRARVLAAIAESGKEGITCDELEVVLSMSHQTASARITELFLRNKIHRRGKRRTRSGRNAWVYRIRKEA